MHIKDTRAIEAIEDRIDDLVLGFSAEAHSASNRDLVDYFAELSALAFLADPYVANDAIQQGADDLCSVMIEEGVLQCHATGQLTGCTIDHYLFDKVVGAGRQGGVYKATDLRSGSTVAIKVVDPTELFYADFIYLGRDVDELTKHNPHVVNVLHRFDDDDGRHFIVMDYIEGPTLDQTIGSEWLKAECLTAAYCIAEGVGTIHTIGCLFRDLKPANVMVLRPLRFVVIDLDTVGFDYNHDRYKGSESRTGTKGYRSPEGDRGEVLLPSSDVYSIGVMLFEMATGIRRAELSEEDYKKHLNALPDPIRKLVSWSTHQDYQYRYKCGRDFASAIDAAIRGKPVPEPRLLPPKINWASTTFIAYTASIVACTLAGCAFLIFCWPTAKDQTQPDRSEGAAIAIEDHEFVHFETQPTGAKIAVVQLDPGTWEPRLETFETLPGVTPNKHQLAPGDYLVVAWDPDDESLFHEVHRHVPARGEQRIGDRHMMHLSVGYDGPYDRDHLHHDGDLFTGEVKVPPIQLYRTDSRGMVDCGNVWVDADEVTVGEYGKGLMFDPDLPELIPAKSRHSIRGENAIVWAEDQGKRLLSIDEYLALESSNNQEIFDLHSNLCEWTSNLVPVDHPSDTQNHQRGVFVHDMNQFMSQEHVAPSMKPMIGRAFRYRHYPEIGLRCGRSKLPRNSRSRFVNHPNAVTHAPAMYERN